MNLGLHFRLSDDQAAAVLAAAGDDDALMDAIALLEEDAGVYDRGCETDKAWDPIACALAPEGDRDEWPARGVIGGARSLQTDDDALWVTHLDPAETTEVAHYLAGLSDGDFSAAYRAMPAELRNPEFGPDEEAYALGWLGPLRTFFSDAAGAGEHVVFTVTF
ncbi:DUF1877 family protein [Propioniciclava coleopterorum]|uniref:DUF1877 family protein n=1 Tax=Propioniciclava coleopterorum TaxID=2714937 RepID=A0A6G7Y3D7_9ACTN|nr:DUF1877 family protein [Propioniciclava coleopterorum]QIK71293.1 DUF1877 family protein [Propioniciclava coleopterorum]